MPSKACPGHAKTAGVRTYTERDEEEYSAGRDIAGPMKSNGHGKVQTSCTTLDPLRPCRTLKVITLLLHDTSYADNLEDTLFQLKVGRATLPGLMSLNLANSRAVYSQDAEQTIK